MSRRDMLATGMMGTALSGSVEGPPAVQRSDDDEELVKRLSDIASEIDEGRRASSPGEYPGVFNLRENMLQFLKSTNKWPDFIDVGPRVWFRLYDWHVRFGQQTQVSRLPDGHYALTFMFTSLVLRQEQSADYIGPGYEKEK